MNTANTDTAFEKCARELRESAIRTGGGLWKYYGHWLAGYTADKDWIANFKKQEEKVL